MQSRHNEIKQSIMSARFKCAAFMKHFKSFLFYKQFRPCSMILTESHCDLKELLFTQFCEHTVFIVMFELKVCLVTNHWYTQNHYFFRNLTGFQAYKNGPLIIFVTTIDPKSVFVESESPCAKQNQTFFQMLR